MMQPPPTPEPIIDEKSRRKRRWALTLRDLFKRDAKEVRTSWTDSATALKKYRAKNRRKNRTARESRRVQMARYKEYHG